MNLVSSNNRSNRTRNFGKVVALAVLMAAGLTAPQAMADHGFGQVGSAGTVDEKDLGIYQTKGAIMTIKPSAPNKSTLNVRYNIVNVEGLLAAEGDNHWLRVRYKDNGPKARVILKLKSYNLGTGEIETHWTFDSDDHEVTEGYGSVLITDGSGDWQFLFGNNIYYIDAIIKQSSASGEAALGGFYLSNY